MKKVSIKDIAQELNLSRNTVSKALSNSEVVSDETRQAVLKKASELGYSKLDQEINVHFIKKNENQIKNIVVLAQRDVSSFWDEIALGVFDKIDKDKFNVLYNFISNDEEEKEIMPANLYHQNVVGILILNVFSEKYVQKLNGFALPMVFLDAPEKPYLNKVMGDVVLVDGYNSVYEITSAMIAAGKKKIAFIGDVTYCKTICDRYEGYLKAMRDGQCQVFDHLCLTDHQPNRYYLNEDVVPVLERLSEIPEAFVCANDDIALWVLKYYQDKGVRVPEDLVISGFDNRREYVAMGYGITTVEVNKVSVGIRLAQELLWRIDNREMPNETVLVGTKIKYGKTFPKM